MFRKNKKEKNTFGIIGLGKFGTSLALELANSGEEIVVLDSSEEKVREIREYTENAFVVHNLDKHTLEESGIQNCEIVIVCIGERMDTSILTTLNLVSLGVEKVIAKANGPEHGEILEKLGADVVFPEHDMALRLASRLKSSSTIDFVRLSEKINVTKIQLPEKLIGKTVIESDLRSKFSLNIIAIENNEDVIETINPNYIFRKNDILYVSGSNAGITKFGDWIHSKI